MLYQKNSMNIYLSPFFLCIILSFSCAKSRYVDEIGLTRQNTELTSGKCALFFQGQGLCLDYQWEIVPQEDQFASMFLTFYLAANSTEYQSPQAEVKVELWMPSMSHGSAPVTVSEISPGHFHAENMSFYMAGDWEVRIQLKNAQGQIIEQQTIALVI